MRSTPLLILHLNPDGVFAWSSYKCTCAFTIVGCICPLSQTPQSVPYRKETLTDLASDGLSSCANAYSSVSAIVCCAMHACSNGISILLATLQQLIAPAIFYNNITQTAMVKLDLTCRLETWAKGKWSMAGKRAHQWSWTVSVISQPLLLSQHLLCSTGFRCKQGLAILPWDFADSRAVIMHMFVKMMCVHACQKGIIGCGGLFQHNSKSFF